MQRIDKLLVEKGYFESRSSAQAAIMAGLISVKQQVVQKASTLIDEDVEIKIKETQRYVSRGALKLKKALDTFAIDVNDKVALDAGTSTGGFAQVLLEQGAKKVIAVDVGYGQFDYKLRQDTRIELHERTNIRYFDAKSIDSVDLAVADLSFISVIKVIDNMLKMLKGNGELLILIKPQFEAEPKFAKKGVVRDKQVHKRVLFDVIHGLEKKKLYLSGLTYSPITGPKGNMEFLAYFKRRPQREIDVQKNIENVVNQAHKELE